VKILVVDDEQAVRDVCAAILARHDFIPILAQNGSQALELYQEMSSEIALTLSDIAMPIMGGLELARNIFELQPKSKVILMTGFSPEDIAPEDLKALCAVLEKPFSQSQLITAVKKCLQCENQQFPELANLNTR
jgi:DNA-binding NtrC family response regulator